MTLPEQMAKAAYEKREPGMVWSALSEASREAMAKDMRVGLEEAVARSIYESRNGAGCKPWSLQTKDHKAPYLADARAAVRATDKWDTEERGRKEGTISAGVSDKSMPVMEASRSYADLADSATTFDPEEQFDRDIDARKDRGS